MTLTEAVKRVLEAIAQGVEVTVEIKGVKLTVKAGGKS